MLKKAILIFLIFVAIYILLIKIAPPIVDKKYNTTVKLPPYNVKTEAYELHKQLDFVADLHCDVLLWGRDINQKHDYGHLDIPRMQEANMALQAFTIVSKTPKNLNFDSNSDETDNVTLLTFVKGESLSAVFSLKERAISQASSLHQFADNSNGQFRVIHSEEELEKFIDDRKDSPSLTAGFLGIEGAHPLEGKLENIEILFDAGIRMVGLVHFFDNELGGSAHGLQKGGLTEFGKKAVLRMQELEIMIDLSHASPKLIDDVLAITKKPIIVSHTGVKGTCNNVRNLSDAHLIKIAATGGLVGIAMFKKAVCGSNAKATAKAIRYAVDKVGISHIALGSDFDGAVRTPFDVTGFPQITEALMKQGFNKAEISLIMGGNIKQFLLKNLP